MSKRLLAAFAAVGLWAVPAFAGVIRDDVPDSSYLALGANSAYASVGRFNGRQGTSGFSASGVLIAPQWVLTAGHVVDRTTALTYTLGGVNYTADRWVANPSWTGNLNTGYDIGLVHLAQPITTTAPAIRYTGTAELGQIGTAVGFGMTGTGLTGSTTFDGLKRGEQNVIDRLQNPRLFLSDFDNPRNRRDSIYGSWKPLPLEGLIAPGDSGGGVFINSNGKTYLAGINSFAGAYDGNVNSDYGDISGHIRVSAFNSWIDSVIGGSSGVLSASYSSGGLFVNAVPEPSSVALLALAGAGVGWWLTRRKKR